MLGGKRMRIAVAAALAASCAAASASASSGSPRGATHRVAPAGSVARVSSLESGVLASLNQIRVAHGLVPLRLSTGLAAAAREHSQQMAVDGYFAHESYDGSAFWKRIQHYYAQGRRSYWSVGENLLWSSPDVDAAGALQMWMDSPEHRANILTARWREIGVAAVHVSGAPGVYHGLDVTIVTTDFGVRR
jgi:uncharacterized protein YkwD